MKIAIVHDYLYQFGGAEKCVEKWLQIYPKADIFTSFFVPQKFASSDSITLAYNQKRLKTTFLQKLFDSPFWLKFHKHLFFIYPLVFGFYQLKNYDLVIISSTFCAKNIRLKNCQKIVFYCHTPTRFLYNLVTKEDQQNLSFWQKIIMPPLLFGLKILDQRVAKKLNSQNCIWLANSAFIQQKIQEIYKTASQVIFPPIELDKFLPLQLNNPKKDSFYLCHGRISFHKRIDLAILACLKLQRKLKISGLSSLPKEMEYLKNLVKKAENQNPNLTGLVEFVGKTSDDELKSLIQNSKAFLFPGREDFGISPIEMLASGLPVIAYKAGGALEYIKPNWNGIFFEKQTVQDLAEAILEFEKQSWAIQKIKESSKAFDSKYFIEFFGQLASDSSASNLNPNLDFNFNPKNNKLSLKVSGEVMHGDKIGRKIGFPTANIYPNEIKILPLGIYAGKVFFDQKVHQAAIYIGQKPTFKDSDLKVEVHILDFDEEIYGQILQVEILEKIRGDIKFDSVEDLKKQINQDCQKIRQLLSDQIHQS